MGERERQKERERERGGGGKRTHIHTPDYYRVIKHCRRSYCLTFREEVWRAGT